MRIKQIHNGVNLVIDLYMYIVPVARSTCQLHTQREDAILGAQDNR